VIVVSNTSPITSLAAIGYLNLLHDIYGTIIIPVAVYEEMTGLGYSVPGTIEVQTLSWIEKRELENRLLLEELQKELHRRESETIALAISSNADRVIIDENPGRKKAISLGLNAIGILGILLIAKRRRLIPTIQPLMDDLIFKAGFRVNQILYLDILKTAQEIDENQ
jgi:predicted nucleic acid-binding protein